MTYNVLIGTLNPTHSLTQVGALEWLFAGLSEWTVVPDVQWQCGVQWTWLELACVILLHRSARLMTLRTGNRCTLMSLTGALCQPGGTQKKNYW